MKKINIPINQDMTIQVSPLSKELKVACEIYWCNKHNMKCTFQRLITTFKRYNISKNQVSSALDTLFDWGILHASWDEELKSRLHTISKETKPTIKEMYKKYWKKERKQLYHKFKNIK